MDKGAFEKPGTGEIVTVVEQSHFKIQNIEKRLSGIEGQLSEAQRERAALKVTSDRMDDCIGDMSNRIRRIAGTDSGIYPPQKPAATAEDIAELIRPMLDAAEESRTLENMRPLVRPAAGLKFGRVTMSPGFAAVLIAGVIAVVLLFTWLFALNPAATQQTIDAGKAIVKSGSADP